MEQLPASPSPSLHSLSLSLSSSSSSPASPLPSLPPAPAPAAGLPSPLLQNGSSDGVQSQDGWPAGRRKLQHTDVSAGRGTDYPPVTPHLVTFSLDKLIRQSMHRRADFYRLQSLLQPQPQPQSQMQMPQSSFQSRHASLVNLCQRECMRCAIEDRVLLLVTGVQGLTTIPPLAPSIPASAYHLLQQSPLFMSEVFDRSALTDSLLEYQRVLSMWGILGGNNANSTDSTPVESIQQAIADRRQQYISLYETLVQRYHQDLRKFMQRAGRPGSGSARPGSHVATLQLLYPSASQNRNYSQKTHPLHYLMHLPRFPQAQAVETQPLAVVLQAFHKHIDVLSRVSLLPSRAARGIADSALFASEFLHRKESQYGKGIRVLPQLIKLQAAVRGFLVRKVIRSRPCQIAVLTAFQQWNRDKTTVSIRKLQRKYLPMMADLADRRHFLENGCMEAEQSAGALFDQWEEASRDQLIGPAAALPPHVMVRESAASTSAGGKGDKAPVYLHIKTGEWTSEHPNLPEWRKQRQAARAQLVDELGRRIEAIQRVVDDVLAMQQEVWHRFCDRCGFYGASPSAVTPDKAWS